MEELDLSSFFTTKAQATDFSSRLATISEKIYKTHFNLEKTCMDEFGIKKKDAFIKLLRDNKVNVESSAELQAFFKKIQEKTATLPVLSLTVAFEPREQTLKELSEWFLLNINKQALFDITVDRNLIAGAVINFQGKSLDFSVRPKFDQILSSIMAPKAEETATKKAKGKEEATHIAVENFSMGR
jgi:F0F1-type ATP synthase delta subunit